MFERRGLNFVIAASIAIGTTGVGRINAASPLDQRAELHSYELGSHNPTKKPTVEYSGLGSEEKRVLFEVAPSLYKIQFTPMGSNLPSTNFCTGWAIDAHTLVTSYHCARRYTLANGQVISTVDSNGNPLYTATAYQNKSMTTGKWELKWVPPPNLQPPYTSAIDIGIWKSEKPFPTSLPRGDSAQLQAGESIFVVHYPHDSFVPRVTPGWLIDATEHYLVQASGSLRGAKVGSSGGVMVTKGLRAIGSMHTGVSRGTFSDFNRFAANYGVGNEPGVSALIQGTSLKGLSLLGY